jgi:valyl-tRNA synthetase
MEAKIAASRKKLANPEFVAKAKPEVVANERTRLAEAEDNLAKLREQRKALQTAG